MYTDTEGIILKQIKTVGGRRMIVLFSEKYGKISAGTSVSERGKNKSNLALRPFTLGRYELFKNKDSYNINAAETLESFYSLGEDVDKYMAASYVLELTENILPEDQPAPGMFSLVREFLRLMEKRRNAYGTLVVAFMIKALAVFGSAPVTDRCVRCGHDGEYRAFSVKDGGLVCAECLSSTDELDPLIFGLTNDIISVIKFMETHPLRSLENLALPEGTENMLRRILRQYYSYHLGIDNLKSEGLKI